MPDWFAHESAYVDDGATIGEGTKIWHFSHIMPGAVIGRRCSLGQNVVVMNGTRIGDEVKIQNNVSVYEGVTLEDHVFCVQGHPEFVPRLSQILMQKRRAAIGDEVVDAGLVSLEQPLDHERIVDWMADFLGV